MIGLSQHAFYRYFETNRYNKIFQLRFPLQSHHPLYGYFKTYCYYKIRNYEISLY